MLAKSGICKDCPRDCDGFCSAKAELQAIYDQMRTGQKCGVIKRLREDLQITDAEISPELKALAKKLISKLPELRELGELDVKIGYVLSYERKTGSGRAVFADCRKVSVIYGAYLPFDFIVTFYEPNISELSENQLKILMWHELKHIGIGEKGFRIEPHDIEDFYDITDAHSTRWNEAGHETADILR